MSEAPSVISTGRSANGTSALGHKLAEGNRRAAKVQTLRSALLQAVSPADLRGVVRRLADAAKNGEVSAAKLLFDRLLGPALPLDIEERMAALEEKLTQKTTSRKVDS